MRRFFIDYPQVTTGHSYRIGDPDARHIKDVLRLAPGTDIQLFDGAGRQFKACINSICPNAVEVTVNEQAVCRTESPIRITVAQAFLKQKKMDTLVRQLTELGIDSLLPVITERVINRPEPNRLPARLTRWETIAREAVKQCDRGLLPNILLPVSYGEALKKSRPVQTKLIFTTGRGLPLRNIAADPAESDSAMILLGPEGGFTPHEIQTAEDHGFIPVTLGPRILKADTASLAACALIQGVFGDMG